jgi:hypothetical protein
MRPRQLLAASLLVLFSAGCTTLPEIRRGAPFEEPAGQATIKGSEESSALLDNFTAYISAVDDRLVPAGRAGWNTPLELKAGRRILSVEFKRGVFSAKAKLELLAAAHAGYQLEYKTDAQLFGKNSFCDFWVVDAATGQAVTAVIRAAVEKGD